MSPHLRWQRWLGAGVAAVAGPLAFSGAVAPVFLVPLVFTGLALLLARKVLRPCPNWLENLLAPLILSVVLVTGGLQFGIMRPVAHLLVLLAAVRLWGGGLPGRRPSSLMLLALLTVAGVASSTHPLLAVYLMVLLGGVVLAVSDLLPHALAAQWGTLPPSGRAPHRLVGATVILAVVVSVPLFVLVPRLRSPFAVAGVGGRSVSGFREAVALHQLGAIKTSRKPMLRVRFPQAQEVNPSWLRFAGATMSHYKAGRWIEPRQRAEQEAVARGLGEGRQAELTLEQTSDRLFAPPGTTGVLPPPGIEPWMDGAEAYRIPRQMEPPITYQVSFLPEKVQTRAPGPEDLAVNLPQARLKELAEEATVGATSESAKAAALESFLQRRFRYSTVTNTPLRADPVEWFLWTSREGHCEFFASSMVLLLRVLGIPARLQTGFAGGQSLGQGEFLLRDANAHAWVLAFVDGRWRVFDPTPPEGQPAVDLGTSLVDLRAIWGNVEAFWDRWILTFSLVEQLQVLLALWQVFRRVVFWGLVGSALLAMLMAFRRRQKRQAALVGRISPLGRTLQTVARKAGWSQEEFHLASPSQVLATLLPRLERARSECLWLFAVHEKTVFGGMAPPPRRRVARAVRGILKELSAPSLAKARTTSGPVPSSKGAEGPRPKRPPGSGR